MDIENRRKKNLELQLMSVLLVSVNHGCKYPVYRLFYDFYWSCLYIIVFVPMMKNFLLAENKKVSLAVYHFSIFF
jgi:hypothetical protein